MDTMLMVTTRWVVAELHRAVGTLNVVVSADTLLTADVLELIGNCEVAEDEPTGIVVVMDTSGFKLPFES